MTVPADALVFDTGPLRHFAAQGWLAVLRFLAAGRAVYIPEAVEDELRRASEHNPTLGAVLNAEWITVHRATDVAYLATFASYESRLAVGRTNLGECGVLAMGEVYGCEIVIDDNTARQVAKEKGLRVIATVPLLCDAVRTKQLTLVMVEKLADDLLASEYFLPFEAGGFRRHVIENGLLDYDDS